MNLSEQFFTFLLRWALNSLGLWVSARLISSIDFEGSILVLVGAGLLLSLINTLIKPLLVILSLPFIVVTLGLFMLLINGLTVYLTAALVPGLEMSFWGAILAGMIIGLINYALTRVIDAGRE